MILGVGIDICRVGRIRRSVHRLGEPWLAEVLTEYERAHIHEDEDKGLSAAMHFSLKESCSKAIGTGFSNGVRWHDFEISQIYERPGVRLSGRALQVGSRMCPPGQHHWFQLDVKFSRDWVRSTAIFHAGDSARVDLSMLDVPGIALGS